MRPPGEVRQALASAAQELAGERGAATWRDIAERACTGYDVARDTVRNMARAGVLEPVGTQRVDGACRPMVLYAPAAARPAAPMPLDLARAINSWATFV